MGHQSLSPHTNTSTSRRPWHGSLFCLPPLSNPGTRSGSVSDRSARPVPERPLPSGRLPGPYQEPYKVPTHYQTKKKQYQLESYQEPYVEEEHTVPKPFAYQYGGVDSQGLESSKVENQGEDGVVRGEYRVQLPDGRTQIVSYTADEEHGYQAEVRYEGEARPEVPEPNDYLGPEGQVRVRQYPKHTRQPYGRYRYTLDQIN